MENVTVSDVVQIVHKDCPESNLEAMSDDEHHVNEVDLSPLEQSQKLVDDVVRQSYAVVGQIVADFN